jgi:predicted acylesterase/phospholipase RssA
MDKYKNVYFSSGGLKGFAFLGVLKYIEQYNIVFENYYGTSVGAFTCLLIILGYTYKELKKILFDFDPSDLLEHSFENLIERNGLSNGDKFNNFIKIFIKNKGFDPEISLDEFYKQTSKTLTVTGCNINKEKTVYISKITFPDMKVWQAIRISCNIPFVFEPVEINKEMYIDGFILDECVLDNFHDKIKESLCIILEKKNNTLQSYGLVEYLTNIIRLPVKHIKRRSYQEMQEKGYNCIFIQVEQTDNINFKISNKTKLSFINTGYNNTLKFFQNIFFQPK